MELVACARADGPQAGNESEQTRGAFQPSSGPWKLPLPDFIARIYIRRIGKMPNVVKTVEEVAVAETGREARRLCKGAAT